MWVFRQVFEITLRLAQVVEKALHEAPDFRTLELEVARGRRTPRGSCSSRRWRRWISS